MADFLDRVVEDVKKTIGSGYYNVKPVRHEKISLKKAILSCVKTPVITEFKPASPSKGVFKRIESVEETVSSMEKAGATGISILTEPTHFQGSIQVFNLIRRTVGLPLLMKDFIISRVQVEAASRIGADAVLLIQALFDKGYSEIGLREAIRLIHSHGLEVLLETHTEDEFLRAVGSEADLIGINNRDLSTLSVDINTTSRILGKHDHHGKVVVSESGIESPEHIRLLKKVGTKAFLVGTAVMLADNVVEKVRLLVEA
ncbi:MAG: indole-3-glycerol-phosphate synthase [Thermoproteota archaeon]